MSQLQRLYPRPAKRSHTVPMGRVLSLTLPDRQHLPGSLLCSCNRNITYTAHTITAMSRNIYPGTHTSKYFRKYVLMYSCTPLHHYSCTHAPCTMYPVHLYPCTLYSCTILVNVRHSATATMSMTNISVISLKLLSRQKSKENIKHTYRISSSSSSR